MTAACSCFLLQQSLVSAHLASMEEYVLGQHQGIPVVAKEATQGSGVNKVSKYHFSQACVCLISAQKSREGAIQGHFKIFFES